MANFKLVDKKYMTQEDALNLLNYIIRKSYRYEASRMIVAEEEVIWAQMNYYKKYYGKTDGNQINHYILSFDTQYYERDIELSTIVQCANMLAFKFYEYQPVWGLHRDSTHYHIHLATNTINIEDGKRFHMNQWEFQRFLRDLAEELSYYHIALLPVSYYDEKGRFRYGNVPGTHLYENKDPFVYGM